MEKAKCGACHGKGYVRVPVPTGGSEVIFCRFCKKPKGRLITVVK